MLSKDFLKSGHTPTLFSAFLYFDMSFMVWVLLGALGVQIATSLGLTPAEKGFMVAVPILAGAVLRVVNGLLVDRIGPKLTGTVGQLIVIGGLLSAWAFHIHSYMSVLGLGVVLGVAGASFAVALPLASRWYPPKYQGIALGIAGAGNSGTVFASLFLPSLAKTYGWTTVFAFVAVPLIITFIVYQFLAKDSPDQPAPKKIGEYFGVLKHVDAWWFMLFYGVSFGGFVGLSSSLNIYFNTQYGLSPVTAGLFTAFCVFFGSIVRPVGGGLADRMGGIRTLSIMYSIAAVALVMISFGFGNIFLGTLFIVTAMVSLGMANGAVFQLVPQRFRAEIGVMTGLVGMCGGIGGFYLAASMGLSRQLTGSYMTSLLIFAGLACVALIGLTLVKKTWRTTWHVYGALDAKI